jgi:ribonucleoside-triphosphate reductase
MLIRQSFDERFILKLKELENKYSIAMFDADGIGPDKMDINRFARDFFSKKVVADFASDGNANVDDDSILSLEYEFGKSIQNLNSYYIIWKHMVEDENLGIKAANKMLELCISGALKIHDLHMSLKPYCYAFSLAQLVSKGLPFIRKVKIGPPKHFHSFINLVIQFTAYASNQLAGACAFPDFFVYMDWFARKDFGENYHDKPECMEKVREELQSVVYSWNYPYRGSQSAFTNVNLYDKYFLKDLFAGTIYPDLSRANLDSIDKLQKYYMKWFIEESKNQVFTFPVNTVTFYKDDKNDIQDQDFLNLVSELNCYNGSFNIFTGPLGVLASCCRLRNDTSKVKEYTNSFGAGGASIGSHRVVTINLPRVAYESENDEDYIKRLKYVTKYAQDILDIHREIIVNNINLNKLPLYTHGFMDLSRQFSTVGFIGINEACEIQGYDITESRGSEFAKRMLNTINDMNEERTAKDGHIRNMEQIPGESAAVTFAKKDRMLFTNHKYKIYGNQYIPLWKNVDVEDRINAQGMFDSMCGGGAICHINSTDSLDPDQMKALITTAAKKGCIYYAINMAQCRCNSCGKLYIGKFDKSPCHDAAVTHYLRVVGFLTPVENWIPERRDEFKIRQFYTKEKFIK